MVLGICRNAKYYDFYTLLLPRAWMMFMFKNIRYIVIEVKSCVMVIVWIEINTVCSSFVCVLILVCFPPLFSVLIFLEAQCNALILWMSVHIFC